MASPVTKIHLFACLLACVQLAQAGPISSPEQPTSQPSSAPATALQATAPATIPLAQIMPKLEAIHEDTQNLLIKNNEIKAAILIGLQAQIEAKLKAVREAKLRQTTGQQQAQAPASGAQSGPTGPNGKLGDGIEYRELEEFSNWVEGNLEYAVKNTEATIEALKEEALHNNGMVEYSEQAVKDGIEGVKYWQQAVIFQDKTLKNENFNLEP